MLKHKSLILLAWLAIGGNATTDLTAVPIPKTADQWAATVAPCAQRVIFTPPPLGFNL